MGMKGMAITMPHAVLTLIFLSKGMTYSQIATIQAFYSMADGYVFKEKLE